MQKAFSAVHTCIAWLGTRQIMQSLCPQREHLDYSAANQRSIFQTWKDFVSKRRRKSSVHQCVFGLCFPDPLHGSLTHLPSLFLDELCSIMLLPATAISKGVIINVFLSSFVAPPEGSLPNNGKGLFVNTLKLNIRPFFVIICVVPIACLSNDFLLALNFLPGFLLHTFQDYFFIFHL